MKAIYLLFMCLIFAGVGFAQTSGGPDAYGYTWKNSDHTVDPPAYSWFDITTIGTSVNGLADDNVVGPFNLPNGFHFYWYDVNQFWIGSNGYISFAGDNIASPFPPSIPLASGANNWIAPLLSDLNFSGAGNPAQCYYYIGGDTLCVSYHNVPFWANANPPYTGSNTFQIIFNKADSSITFNFQSTSMGLTSTLDNAVGIENNTGTVGLQVLIDSLPKANFSIKFYYPPVVTFAVTDAGVAWNNNPKNGGIFIPRQAAPMSLTSNIRNYGNQNLGAFTVRDTIYNDAGSVISTGSAGIPSLQVGSDTVVTYSNTFTTTLIGTYAFHGAVTGLPGDLVSTNNSLEQEIVVLETSGAMSLNYSDGIPDGTGLSWSGGNGGIGVYFEPPVYPVEVASTQFLITANPDPAAGFYAKIYDDDGPNGGPGTLLDSVLVDTVDINLNTYTVVPVDNPFTISSGGVYVVWYMAGPGIELARDLTPPISRRTYELLGPGWSDYRDMRTQDFLIGLNVESMAVPVANFSYDASNAPTVSFTDLSTNNPTSWHWDFDDGGGGDTSSLANPVYTFATNGNHNVCLTANNSNGSSTPVCQTVSITNIGMGKVGLKNLRISPNPASETLRLELPGGADANWEILDAQGRLVLSGSLTSSQAAIDIQRLAAGMYFLRIEQHGASGEVQWVKE